jgi:hypothetical protein
LRAHVFGDEESLGFGFGALDGDALESDDGFFESLPAPLVGESEAFESEGADSDALASEGVRDDEPP